jgi:hypothetical protein
LDGVVGTEGVRDPMFTIIISTSCYLHFISYTLTLVSFCGHYVKTHFGNGCELLLVMGITPVTFQALQIAQHR